MTMNTTPRMTATELKALRIETKPEIDDESSALENAKAGSKWMLIKLFLVINAPDDKITDTNKTATCIWKVD